MCGELPEDYCKMRLTHSKSRDTSDVCVSSILRDLLLGNPSKPVKGRATDWTVTMQSVQGIQRLEITISVPKEHLDSSNICESNALRDLLVGHSSKLEKSLTTDIVTMKNGKGRLEQKISTPKEVKSRYRIISKLLDKHRHNMRQILLGTNANPIRNYNGKGYYCGYCNDVFPTPPELKQHSLYEHGDADKIYMRICCWQELVAKFDITDFKCILCEDDLNNLEDAVRHLRSQHDRLWYDDITNHILPFKFSKEGVTCPICSQFFISFKLAQEHMRMHYNNYMCNICDMPFVNMGTLRKHMKRKSRVTSPAAFVKRFSRLRIKGITTRGSAVTRSQNVSHNLQKPRSTKRNADRATETELREIYKHHANLNIIRQCSNATPIRSRGGIGYKCCYCTDEYPNPDDLKSHTLEHHSDESARKILEKEMNALYSYVIKLDITALKCNICDTGFDSLDDFIYHLITDHDKKIYTDLEDRIIPLKFEDNILSCLFCLQTFNKFKTLVQHMNIHYNNFVCDVCNTGFVSRNLLYNHSFTHKIGEFECTFCDKIFDTFLKQKAHEKTVHKQACRNTCGFCNEKFRDFKKKEQHLTEIHGVALMGMQCQACSKTFPNRKLYTVHMKRDHLLERKHPCEECDMTFFRMTDLKKHMLKHTGERKYQCSVCKKSYGRNTTLTQHMKIHANIRKYKCEYCDQKFIQKCTWKGHLKAKHGVVLQ
ncbi:unnamed protein product [Diatraea saccharalis]|uniref:C2H2-type domain-containing protein n=1 Tax=Diatraea saccharalis TaxID=40085 RepID=A0A9N9R4Z6_9NEOP|nr:unnamed protein product [Diatraea saccharalis]